MSSQPPPNPITNVFNVRDWIQNVISSKGFTQEEADELYLSKLVDNLSIGIPTFSGGIETWKMYAPLSITTATDLASWIAGNPINQNFIAIGSFYQLNGYSIVPVTTAGIKYYPASSNPISFSSGVYNIHATIVLSASSISGAGRFSFGVTTNASASSWLPSSNGGYVGNIIRVHLPTVASADLPIILSVNFTAEQTGSNLYFIYEIQGTITGGSLIVNLSASRVSGN
jgi:hypothetical protein